MILQERKKYVLSNKNLFLVVILQTNEHGKMGENMIQGRYVKEVSKALKCSKSKRNLSKVEKVSKKKVIILSVSFAVIALGILSAVVIVQQRAASKNIFSKYGETSFANMAEEIVTLVNDDDAIIESEYTKNKLENIVPLRTITSTKENLANKNVGKFQKIISTEVSQWDDGVRSYGVVGVTVLYENNTLVFTVSFDQNLKLWLLSFGDSDSTHIKK